MRHVSPAFAEDPVRILRVARFAARFADFRVAPETLALMREMVAAGEVDALVAERVWQELARGLMEHKPSRMFAVLRDCGALARLLPEVDALWGVPQRADYHPGNRHRRACDDGDRHGGAPRRAAAGALRRADPRPGQGEDAGRHPAAPPRPRNQERGAGRGLCERLRVPVECRDVARLAARFHGDMHRVEELRPDTRLTILERCDALRRPERFELILLACEADHRGRLGWEERPYVAATRGGRRWRRCARSMPAPSRASWRRRAGRCAAHRASRGGGARRGDQAPAGAIAASR
jgi:tRNA nucleotidyltransferase (CCA-adding enzyme)